MAVPAVRSSDGVFISYRRRDTAPYARLLREELGRRLGAEQVFMDVDSIEIGVDFAEAIQRALDACEVLLALVGPRWLAATDAEGRRRLDNPEDTVRLEIEAALTRNIRVIPVLVDDTPMPSRQELPDSLVPLARRNALELTANRYAYDLGRLLEAVEKAIGRPKVPAGVGDRDRVRALADQALTTAYRIPDDAPKAGVLAEVAKALALAGDLGQAGVVADQALAAAKKIRKGLRLSVLVEVAEGLAHAGQPDQAAAVARQVLAIATSFPEEEPSKSLALVDVAKGFAHAGDLDQALTAATTIPSDDLLQPRALTEVADVLAQAGDIDQARSVAYQARTIAYRIPYDQPKGGALADVAGVLAQAGDIDQAITIASAIPDDRFRAWTLAAVAVVLARLGAEDAS